MVIKYFRNNWRKMIPFALVGFLFNVIELGGTTYFTEVQQTPQKATYAICFIVATIVAYTLNTFITFKSKFTFHNFFRYFGIYIGAMLVGLNMIVVYEHVFHLSDQKDWLYPFMAAPFVYIWNFFLTNKFLKR